MIERRVFGFALYGWANSNANSIGTTFNFELRNTIVGPGGRMGGHDCLEHS
jgi:hypothetical protein